MVLRKCTAISGLPFLTLVFGELYAEAAFVLEGVEVGEEDGPPVGRLRL